MPHKQFVCGMRQQQLLRARVSGGNGVRAIKVQEARVKAGVDEEAARACGRPSNSSHDKSAARMNHARAQAERAQKLKIQCHHTAQSS